MGRTCRDISAILADKCRVTVTASGLHDFIRARSRVMGDAAKSPVNSRPFAEASSAREDVHQKIAAVRARSAAIGSGAKKFDFDPDAPLSLPKPSR